MRTCQCSARETGFFRMKFRNGDIHYREVCRNCRGNARGGAQNVGASELRKRGIDPDSLPFLPEEPVAEPSVPVGPVQRGLFDGQP